jgi:hypothetical protein
MGRLENLLIRLQAEPRDFSNSVIAACPQSFFNPRLIREREKERFPTSLPTGQAGGNDKLYGFTYTLPGVINCFLLFTGVICAG